MSAYENTHGCIGRLSGFFYRHKDTGAVSAGYSAIAVFNGLLCFSVFCVHVTAFAVFLFRFVIITLTFLFGNFTTLYHCGTGFNHCTEGYRNLNTELLGDCKGAGSSVAFAGFIADFSLTAAGSFGMAVTAFSAERPGRTGSCGASYVV